MDYSMIAIATMSWSMLAYLAIGHWSGRTAHDRKAGRKGQDPTKNKR